jgi:hypothetical protein
MNTVTMRAPDSVVSFNDSKGTVITPNATTHEVTLTDMRELPAYLAAGCTFVSFSAGTHIKQDVSVANGNLGDGYGVFEKNANLSGTIGGTIAGESSWINFAAASVPGANLICTHNDGIYLPAGITASSATMIMGARYQYVADDGANPGALHLFSTNIYDNALTSIFHVNAKADFGGSSGAASTNAYKIPFLKDVTANKTWYINVYDG